MARKRRKARARPRRRAIVHRTTRRTRRRYRRNPVALANPRKRTYRKRRRVVAKRRRYRRNPARLKKAFSKDNIINIASLGIGFIGGIKGAKFINQLDFLANYRRFTGVIPFVLGSILAARGKKAAIKAVGAGISLSGLYDLVSQNVPQIGLAPVEGVDLDDYDNEYTDGVAIDVDGTAVDLEGDDDDILVGDEDEPIEMVGNDSPYEMV